MKASENEAGISVQHLSYIRDTQYIIMTACVCMLDARWCY